MERIRRQGLGNQMENLKIETGENNPILRQTAETVKEITPEIKGLVFAMGKTLKAKDALGLAAPQVGKSLRIITVKTDSGALITLINPEIARKSWRKQIMEEGCLSLPEKSFAVKRPKKIAVKGLAPDGKKIKFKAEGLLARIVQHEIDHCDGILISDKDERKQR